jgi:hypothetical protein
MVTDERPHTLVMEEMDIVIQESEQFDDNYPNIQIRLFRSLITI